MQHAIFLAHFRSHRNMATARPSRWQNGELNAAYRPNLASPSSSINVTAPPADRTAVLRGLQPATPATFRPEHPPRVRPRALPYVHSSILSTCNMPRFQVPVPKCVTVAFPPVPVHSARAHQRACALREALANAKDDQVENWLRLSRKAATHSHLVAGLLRSSSADARLARLVRANAPSTLSAYLRMWSHWEKFTEALGASPFLHPDHVLLDFLALRAKGRLSTAQGWVKSLAKKLELLELKASSSTSLVTAYTISPETVARRESAPLPLSFVIWLETQVLDNSASAAHRLRCGSLLVCVFASLRWSDALWSSPFEIYLSQGALIGSAARDAMDHSARSVFAGSPLV